MPCQEPTRINPSHPQHLSSHIATHKNRLALLFKCILMPLQPLFLFVVHVCKYSTESSWDELTTCLTFCTWYLPHAFSDGSFPHRRERAWHCPASSQYYPPHYSQACFSSLPPPPPSYYQMKQTGLSPPQTGGAKLERVNKASYAKCSP